MGAGNVGKKVDGGQGDEKRAKKELKYFSSLFAFSVAAPWKLDLKEEESIIKINEWKKEIKFIIPSKKSDFQNGINL